MTPVNPIEALVAYLKTQMPGVKIDTQHRYGHDWDPLADSALVLVPSGGVPDRDAPLQNLVVDVWCYAPSQYAATELWRDFVTVARATDREPVAVTGGTALVYAIVQEGGPHLLYDSTVGMDVCYSIIVARIGECAA